MKTDRKRIPVLLVATVALCCLAVPGCRSGIDKAAYVRDGVQYGVTEGRFRGRWWNYYERGRSFLEGGFHTEAEADFRSALAGRPRDQLWPRTYGLHFLPEYFPQRELGIALFQQGQVDAAITWLETSLDQQFSARAAYFLDEARRARLQASGADTAAPVLEVIEAPTQTPVGTMAARVRGVVRDDTYVAALRINSAPVDIRVSAPEVRFERTVPLEPGRNVVEVEAEDLTGKTVIQRVPIEADLDGPAISFDRPVTLPGAITGAVFDRSGVAALHIGGRQAALQSGAEGTATFAVTLPENELEAPIEYTCEDVLGNTTGGVLTADRLVLGAAPRHLVLPAAAGNPALNRIQLFGAAGRVVLAVNPEDAGAGVRVDIPNVPEGQEFYRDELVVTLAVEAPEPIASIELNGQPVPSVPGRRALRVSRKVPLETGENLLVARAQSGGAQGEAQRTVSRARSEIEMDKAKLSVAFLARESRVRNPEFTEEAGLIMEELAGKEAVVERFKVVDRELFAPMLAEQQLSEALASRQGKLALGEVIPAEMLLVARVRGDRQSIEIVLDGASTETGVRLASHVDVAGPYEQLDQLIEQLAARLTQEFPRAHGHVIDWDPPEVLSDLTGRQGLRQYFKCVVYETEPIVNKMTGEELGTREKVICDAVVNSVEERFSSMEALTGEEGEDLRVEVGQRVVIK